MSFNPGVTRRTIFTLALDAFKCFPKIQERWFTPGRNYDIIFSTLSRPHEMHTEYYCCVGGPFEINVNPDVLYLVRSDGEVRWSPNCGDGYFYSLEELIEVFSIWLSQFASQSFDPFEEAMGSQEDSSVMAADPTGLFVFIRD